MADSSVPVPEDLAKKPLLEAIFELRWRLEPTGDPSGGRDPGFKILLGRFFDRVRDAYPTVIDLPTAQVPDEMVPYAVRHQFRRGPDAWPLFQLGPGILTANETAGYQWRTFRDQLSDAVSALFASYPKDLYGFAPHLLVLRYLNAIPLDPREVPILPFLKECLHTEVSLDPILGETVHDLRQPWGVNLNVTVPMRIPKGVCGVSFSTGKVQDRPALIWQLEAKAAGKDVPSERDAIDRWLEDAHSVIEKWFFTLARGELLDSFKG